MNRIREVDHTGRYRLTKRPTLSAERYGGSHPYRRNMVSKVVITGALFICFSISFASAFSLLSRQMIRTSTISCREEIVVYTNSMMATSRPSNICLLYEGQNPDQDEMMRSAFPVEPLSSSSQYVQQEQLLELVSCIGAPTIASLSISERAKRAMLAEAVEDEIFCCTEQLIDLVNEQMEHESNNDNVLSELNARQQNDIEKEILDLRERNRFLQAQYNDLVSGRPSSLLNTVNSVGGSTATGESNSSSDIDDSQSKRDNEEDNFTRFN